MQFVLARRTFISQRDSIFFFFQFAFCNCIYFRGDRFSGFTTFFFFFFLIDSTLKFFAMILNLPSAAAIKITFFHWCLNLRLFFFFFFFFFCQTFVQLLFAIIVLFSHHCDIMVLSYKKSSPRKRTGVVS